MMDKILSKHTFVFNSADNGGESLSLTTFFYDNGDGIPDGIYTTQELSLQSYRNSASFSLCGAELSPENLRTLANELESFRNKLVSKLEVIKNV